MAWRDISVSLLLIERRWATQTWRHGIAMSSAAPKPQRELFKGHLLPLRPVSLNQRSHAQPAGPSAYLLMKGESKSPSPNGESAHLLCTHSTRLTLSVNSFRFAKDSATILRSLNLGSKDQTPPSYQTELKFVSTI